jgi:UDP-N-acetylmuramate--alanine ligase
MAQAIVAAARDGDVVLTMGAGSIGGVPGQLARQQQRAASNGHG